MLLRFTSALLLSVLAVLVSAASSPFLLKDAKFTVQSIDGTARISEHFDASKPPSLPSSLSLQADDILRISFSVSTISSSSNPISPSADSESDSEPEVSSSASKPKPSTKNSVPHQVFVVLVDDNDSQRQQSYVVPVKPSSGKATWSLRMDRLPPTLSKSSGSLKLSLLLGSFETQISQSIPISTLNLPSTVLKPSDSSTLSAREVLEIENSFKPHPERRHTFSTPPTENMPDALVSTVASFVTLGAPWVLFLGLILPLSSSLSPKSPSTYSILLLLSLLVLEGLALRFWIGGDFTLLRLLPYLTGAGLITLIVGRGALREMVQLRESGEKKRSGKEKKTE